MLITVRAYIKGLKEARFSWEPLAEFYMFYFPESCSLQKLLNFLCTMSIY